jgi:arginine decarboxylase
MMNKDHNQTPFFTKLLAYAKQNMVAHDVPGHKLGHIQNELLDTIGIETFKMDANAPRGLDNLNNPVGVIKEAADLMADAYGADKAYFLTGGTTMGILSMVMSICRAKEKIIMPRNVHKSAISALILSGAMPVFVKPHIDHHIGIANHMRYEDVLEAVKENPDAVAILVINPTYFGVASDLKQIVQLAHANDMIVMVDEAHGSHLPFSDHLPISAMEAGADMSACSLHKTGGSLTQSSVLVAQGPRIDHIRLRSTINMIQSTSPSSLLLASLDVARKHMYFEGPKILPEIIKMADEARKAIDKIEGLSCMHKQDFIKQGAFDYDETKVIIKVSDLGVSGFEIYKLLADQYKIQVELAETHIILLVLSVGTLKSDLDALILALEDIANHYRAKKLSAFQPRFVYTYPEAYTRPRDAYHSPKKYMLLEQAADEIAAESIMIYPPGIPIVIPGEIISKEIIEDLAFYQKSGSIILSDTEGGFVKVVDKERWFKWEEDSELY